MIRISRPARGSARGCSGAAVSLAELVADKLARLAKGGVNAHLKVPALIGGMVAGVDCIDDMDLLRHGR